MPPPPYLLRVLSKPTQVDEKTWEKWYNEEHVPDVVNGGLSQNGALFRAYNDFSLKSKTPTGIGSTDLSGVKLSHFNEAPDNMTFCAIYQTDIEKPMQSEIVNNLPKTGKLLRGKEHFPLAEWDIRTYKLLQDYDPDKLGDVLSPYCLHVQCEPADEQDYHNFYEKEHLPLLHKVPGYRKSQRYQLIDVGNAPADTPRLLVVHEFEHLEALDGPELHEANATPWVKKVFGNAKGVNVRGFKRASSLGFANS